MRLVTSDERAELQSILDELQKAWDGGDAARFASLFAEDGDQVNIFGIHLKGRAEIAQRHERIFKSIFHQSRNALELREARFISSDILVARVNSTVQIPRGPLQGELKTLATMIFRKTHTGWELVTFHNTRIATD